MRLPQLIHRKKKHSLIANLFILIQTNMQYRCVYVVQNHCFIIHLQ